MATPLETNTTSLQELLSEVNSLPEPVAATTQATPTITVSSAGVITATSTQTEGHVAAGTKTATKQLTTQAAKTITPSTSSQTAVAKNVYTTGTVTVAAIPSTYVKPTAKKAATTYTPTTSNQTIAAGTYCSDVQTIAGDADLVSANIKSGANIFGVAGSASVVDTADATATASDMASGVTAYVNGLKVTGTAEIGTIVAKEAASVTVQSETQLLIIDDCIISEENIIAVYAGFFYGTAKEDDIVSVIWTRSSDTSYLGSVYLVNVMNDKLYPRNTYINSSPNVSQGQITLPANGSSYSDVFNTSAEYKAIIVYKSS